MKYQNSNRLSLAIILPWGFLFVGCDNPPPTTSQPAPISQPAPNANQPVVPNPAAPVEAPLVTMMHGKVIVESFTAKVIGITDGDTIKVLNDAKEQIKVRLESIDTPESKQPYGNVAKDAVAALTFGKMVTVHSTGTDRYGRTLGFVGADGVDVSAHMVATGMAWNYDQYSKSETLPTLEDQARQGRLGLWQDENPIPPWQWRKDH